VKRSAALAPLSRDHHVALERGFPSPGEALTTAHALGELLNDHVRYEERELFPAVEARLEPKRLARLGEAIARAESQT
jgi:hypothetical protein